MGQEAQITASREASATFPNGSSGGLIFQQFAQARLGASGLRGGQQGQPFLCGGAALVDLAGGAIGLGQGQ